MEKRRTHCWRIFLFNARVSPLDMIQYYDYSDISLHTTPVKDILEKINDRCAYSRSKIDSERILARTS